jgi:hypothetical protein
MAGIRPAEKQISVAPNREPDMFPPMARLRTALALLLVALWIPSTAHCLFEGAGVIEADECCKSESPSQPTGHSCAGACATLESGGYRLPKAQKMIQTPVLAALPRSDSTPIVREPEPLHPIIESDSLEPLPPWQFASRAALPPRAP